MRLAEAVGVGAAARAQAELLHSRTDGRLACWSLQQLGLKWPWNYDDTTFTITIQVSGDLINTPVQSRQPGSSVVKSAIYDPPSIQSKHFPFLQSEFISIIRIQIFSHLVLCLPAVWSGNLT